jgi:tetratricopeptide (TPR) repeat protein
MAVRKLQVFLASRFGEFAEHRAALRDRINRIQRPAAEAIDLNDNRADSRPPIERCYAAIEQADVVVLLVGETYGEVLETHGFSYTHLEYRHAVADSRIVLPFFIRASTTSSDKTMSGWLREIEQQQTASKLPPEGDPETLASEIFESVLERLWEIAAEGERPNDDLEDEAPSRDDAPIKRQELASSAKRPADPLKALAASHASEACAALSLNLTQIAIEQLRKAVELSPLDVVPAYWLARLLIASGRFVDCRQGLRLALRCVHVAQHRSDEVPKLTTMAALILAARASERLNDLDDALQYAREAHEDRGFHWLANFELGRQYALSGMPGEALAHAEAAFWARADVIHRIQDDVVYRRLGRRFEEFRAELRATVERDSERILRIELALREFEQQRKGERREPLTSSGEQASARKLPLLAVVRIAKQSARRSLQLLQDWGTTLVDDVRTFKAGAFQGLTPETCETIVGEAERESANIVSLREKLENERKSEARAQWQIRVTTVGLIVGAILLLFALVAASEGGWTTFTVLLILCIVVIGVFLFGGGSSWSARALATANSRRLAAQLERAVATHAGFVAVGREFDVEAARVSSETAAFCYIVDSFERAVDRLPYSPGFPWQRGNVKGIVRIKNKDVADGVLTVDNTLLPPELRHFARESPQCAGHWLARLTSAAPAIANRSKAYFA